MYLLYYNFDIWFLTNICILCLYDFVIFIDFFSILFKGHILLHLLAFIIHPNQQKSSFKFESLM